MRTEVQNTTAAAHLCLTGSRCLLRLVSGIGAFALFFGVSALHTLLRDVAYSHHLLPPVSAGTLENLFGADDGARLLQTIVPTTAGAHPALLIWSSLFWVTPLLAFGIGATLGMRQFLRLLLLHASLLVLSDAVFFIVPTMPPWMADGTPRLLASSVGQQLQIDGNPTAALPSLHVAVPFMAALWLCHHANAFVRVLGRLWMLRVALMFWAIVYTGEHYVLDGVAGMMLAFAVYRAYDYLGLAQVGLARRPIRLVLPRRSPRIAAHEPDLAAA